MCSLFLEQHGSQRMSCYFHSRVFHNSVCIVCGVGYCGICRRIWSKLYRLHSENHRYDHIYSTDRWRDVFYDVRVHRVSQKTWSRRDALSPRKCYDSDMLLCACRTELFDAYGWLRFRACGRCDISKWSCHVRLLSARYSGDKYSNLPCERIAISNSHINISQNKGFSASYAVVYCAVLSVVSQRKKKQACYKKLLK
jgi:hypothetical protein